MMLSPQEPRSFTVAIHQPNFFPWIGYFDKLKRCDQFILLDDVQYQKTGGTWGNRVKLVIAGESRWVTAPVDRSYHGVKMINEVVFDDRTPWREKLIRSIEGSYRKARAYNEVMPWLEPLIRKETQSVAAYNEAAILAISDTLGIATNKIVYSSRLKGRGTSSDLLIDLIAKVGGTAYICGAGAEAYQTDSLFEQAGIRLVRQNFTPIPYLQAGSKNQFLPGASIIDALLNLGFDQAKALLEMH